MEHSAQSVYSVAAIRGRMMTMSGEIDPRWPKTLSQSAHEFRTPITVVAGYIRMLLRDKAGALSDQQRRLLEEAEKSCGRLTALVAEMSELSQLDAGTTAFNKEAADLNTVLRTAVEQLPPLPDREVRIDLEPLAEPAPLNGDAAKLGKAIGAVVAALRREVVATDRLFVRVQRTPGNASTYQILIGDEAALGALAAAPPETDIRFDEWRGGAGLSLVTARRILNAHGGTLQAPSAGGKTGARIILSKT